jgi:predicted nucleic acid-binding protein
LSVYLDTSFLVSVYAADAHTPVAIERLSSVSDIQLTPFNRAELGVALFQQIFLHRATDVEILKSWDSFERDCRSGIWRLVDLPERAWKTTIDLARNYCAILGVRTLDSLHVACALELGADRFWTFDERQARLAEAVGLNTTS